MSMTYIRDLSDHQNETVTLKGWVYRSEEHTSELQSRGHVVCRLLLEKKTAGMVGGGGNFSTVSFTSSTDVDKPTNINAAADGEGDDAVETQIIRLNYTFHVLSYAVYC